MISKVLFYFFIIELFMINSLFAQYSNVKIFGSINSMEPEECSIVINPQNPNHILAASNQDNYFYSTDGGQTWQHGIVQSDYGVLGDPVVVAGANNKYFYFYIANNLSRVGCHRLNNLGSNWSKGSFVGANGSQQNDKDWAAVNLKNNYLYVTWSQFDKHGSSNPLDSSVVLLCRSTDEGESWSAPIQISNKKGDATGGNTSSHAPMPAIGPNNDVYVTWMSRDGLMFDKSTDGGLKWLSKDIQVTPNRINWLSFNISGVQRTPGFPVINCDLSESKYKGNIYICWSDHSLGTNNSDIWFVKSTDGGNIWTSKKRVNDDNSGKHQFFAWMTIDQTNGNLYFVFYDRRNYPEGDTRTDVYMAVSKDGGETFENFKISDTPFSPNQSNFIGDYIGISAHNNIIRPIWTRVDNNQLSLWTAFIDSESVNTERQPDSFPSHFEIVSVYPNPFNPATTIKYKIDNEGLVVIKIFDPLGKEVEKIFEGRKSPGEYKIDWNAKNIASGTYFIKITLNSKSKTEKIVLTR